MMNGKELITAVLIAGIGFGWLTVAAVMLFERHQLWPMGLLTIGIGILLLFLKL